jgi:hypothetical protein
MTYLKHNIRGVNNLLEFFEVRAGALLDSADIARLLLLLHTALLGIEGTTALRGGFLQHSVPDQSPSIDLQQLHRVSAARLVSQLAALLLLALLLFLDALTRGLGRLKQRVLERVQVRNTQVLLQPICPGHSKWGKQRLERCSAVPVLALLAQLAVMFLHLALDLILYRVSSVRANGDKPSAGKKCAWTWSLHECKHSHILSIDSLFVDGFMFTNGTWLLLKHNLLRFNARRHFLSTEDDEYV